MQEILLDTYTIALPIILGYIVWLLKQTNKKRDANTRGTSLDQMSEVVAYIKSNKSLIDAITTSKVSVSDIIDNLTTNVSNKPLSAAQGVALKALIDGITIPEKLPNPYPLTFTGGSSGSYDGSEPVSVEIPIGGGSGGTTPTGAEKIVEFTVSADLVNATSLKFTIEEYPKLAEYNHFRGLFKKGTNGGLPWIQIKANDKAIGQTANGNNGLFGFEITKNDKYYLGGVSGLNNTSLYYNFTQKQFPNMVAHTYLPIYIENLNNIEFYSYTTFLDEGATVEIWGWND